MALGRVKQVKVQKARNQPNKLEVVSEDSGATLFAAGTELAVQNFLVDTLGMQRGNAERITTRGKEVGGIIVGVTTLPHEDTPSTPTLSAIVGVGAQS